MISNIDLESIAANAEHMRAKSVYLLKCPFLFGQYSRGLGLFGLQVFDRWLCER